MSVCVRERHVYMRSSFLVQVKRVYLCVCVCIPRKSPSKIPTPPSPYSYPNYITLTLNSTRQFTGLLMWWWYGCPANPPSPPPRIAPTLTRSSTHIACPPVWLAIMVLVLMVLVQAQDLYTQGTPNCLSYNLIIFN